MRATGTARQLRVLIVSGRGASRSPLLDAGCGHAELSLVTLAGQGYTRGRPLGALNFSPTAVAATTAASGRKMPGLGDIRASRHTDFGDTTANSPPSWTVGCLVLCRSRSVPTTRGTLRRPPRLPMRSCTACRSPRLSLTHRRAQSPVVSRRGVTGGKFGVLGGLIGVRSVSAGPWSRAVAVPRSDSNSTTQSDGSAGTAANHRQPRRCRTRGGIAVTTVRWRPGRR